MFKMTENIKIIYQNTIALSKKEFLTEEDVNRIKEINGEIRKLNKDIRELEDPLHNIEEAFKKLHRFG